MTQLELTLDQLSAIYIKENNRKEMAIDTAEELEHMENMLAIIKVKQLLKEEQLKLINQ